MLIGEMLRLNANRFPRKPALISGGISLDYAALEAQANRCANALMALGLRPQAKLCLMARNVAAYPIIHFGAARTNLVLAHASFRYTADELAYVLDKMDVEVLLVERPFAPVAAQALEKIGGLEHVMLINGEDDFGADEFQCLVRNASVAWLLSWDVGITRAERLWAGPGAQRAASATGPSGTQRVPYGYMRILS